MQEQEIIIVNGISETVYEKILRESIRYALVSIAFTFNRMYESQLETKIMNIAKGKIAEEIFKFFCEQNNIDANFISCTTPFYQPDKRDFLWNNIEWDIKNNFIYHPENILHPAFQYIDLPALIPNQHRPDQWDKRSTTFFKESKGAGYVFTFMKNGDKKSTTDFFSIQLKEQQRKFILDLYKKYEINRNLLTAPFTEDWFWEKFFQRSPASSLYKARLKPSLIIAGYAMHKEFDLFTDSGNGGKKYCNGILFTKINNRFTEIKNLPSFASLFPKLHQKMHLAEFRK